MSDGPWDLAADDRGVVVVDQRTGCPGARPRRPRALAGPPSTALVEAPPALGGRRRARRWCRQRSPRSRVPTVRCAGSAPMGGDVHAGGDERRHRARRRPRRHAHRLRRGHRCGPVVGALPRRAVVGAARRHHDAASVVATLASRPTRPRCASSTSRTGAPALGGADGRLRPPHPSLHARRGGARDRRRPPPRPGRGARPRHRASCAGRRRSRRRSRGDRARGRRPAWSRWSTTSVWSRCSTSPPGGCRWQHDLAARAASPPGWP